MATSRRRRRRAWGGLGGRSRGGTSARLRASAGGPARGTHVRRWLRQHAQASVSQIGLMSVSQLRLEMGKLAVQLVQEGRDRGGRVSRRTLFAPRLLVRRTTGPAPAGTAG